MDATPSPGSVDACTVPAAAPPEGMTSNFVHPNETLEMPMIIIGAVTTFLAVLSTVIRVHVNFRKLHAADCKQVCYFTPCEKPFQPLQSSLAKLLTFQPLPLNLQILPSRQPFS